MQVTNLKLINFRNYEFLDLAFSKKKNIFYGENGSGKTNILESIYVLALTKSFRAPNDKILIKTKAKKLKIEGEILDKRRNKYLLELNDLGKTVKINKNKISKLSDYISNISVVLFSPDDFKLIKDTPMVRRKLLNVDIIEFDREYLDLLNKYNKVLKHRNSYLRTMYLNNLADVNYLEVITNNLIDAGIELYKKRTAFLDNINNLITTKYYKITKIADLKIEYLSEYKNLNKKELLSKYKKNIKKDMAFGKTTIGVHHDDYKFMFKNLNIRDYGSEGQQKNAVIAYKLSLIDLFVNKKGQYPILLLDDLFSELDKIKIGHIVNLLKKRIQIFITTTELENLNQKLLKNSKIFKVKQGKVEVSQDEA